jgi:hypothetical protein
LCSTGEPPGVSPEEEEDRRRLTGGCGRRAAQHGGRRGHQGLTPRRTEDNGGERPAWVGAGAVGQSRRIEDDGGERPAWEGACAGGGRMGMTTAWAHGHTKARAGGHGGRAGGGGQADG